MAILRFTVPDELKQAFYAAFAGQNKGAVLVGLMRRAVEESELGRLRAQLFTDLTASKANRTLVTSNQIAAARRAGRQ